MVECTTCFLNGRMRISWAKTREGLFLRGVLAGHLQDLKDIHIAGDFDLVEARVFFNDVFRMAITPGSCTLWRSG